MRIPLANFQLFSAPSWAKKPDRKILMTKIDSILESIKRSDAFRGRDVKDLLSGIDCGSASPEGIQLPLKARNIGRVSSIFGCRPEVASDPKVIGAASQLFDDQSFKNAHDFVDSLWEIGLITSVGVCAPAQRSLYTSNFSGISWLLNKVRPGTLEQCDGLAGEFLSSNFFASHEELMSRIAVMKLGGFSLAYNDDLLFRMACDGWLDYGFRG